MINIGGRHPPATPCSARNTYSVSRFGAKGQRNPRSITASTAPIVNRFSVSVTPNHGANTIVAAFVASKRAVSQVPSSLPIENAPRISASAAAVTCSFNMARSDASSIPIRPIARRSGSSGSLDFSCIGVSASRAETCANDPAALGSGVPVVGGLAAFMIDLILGDGFAFLKLTKIAYRSIPFTNLPNVAPANGTTPPSGNDPFPFGQQNKFHQGGSVRETTLFWHALKISGQ